MKCGLLGRKLGHSYSPQIHAYLGAYSYELFEREPEDVESFLKSGDFSLVKEIEEKGYEEILKNETCIIKKD